MAQTARMARVSTVAGYIVLGGVIVLGILVFVAAAVVRWLLAPKAPTYAKLKTYESGMDPIGEGWAQTNVRYFVYAFLYVIFAVDAVYLFPWANVIRDQALGVPALIEMAIFIGIIVLGLAHAARRGLLRWV